MDTSALYELRNRLCAGAIAGTQLLSDDFRLKRAVEAFAPLEEMAPVFGQIGKLSRAVIAPECPDRAGLLMDALSLADAVLCTQAAVSVSGDILPAAAIGCGSSVISIPYSVLSALLDALQNSGGGRYRYVCDTWKEHPELFKDYRVKGALVKALDDSYGELADLAENCLREEGAEILPILKIGFDPRGRRGMVRRVELIDAIAAGKDNDFYLSQLEEAVRDVRLALIYAMRHENSNARKLLELTKTEKGRFREIAYCALFRLSEESAWKCWRELYAKKPCEAVRYLTLSHVPPACHFTAEAFLELFHQLSGMDWLESKKEGAKKQRTERQEELLSLAAELFHVLPGKGGLEICDIYRGFAAIGDSLDTYVQIQPIHFGASGEKLVPFSEMAAVQLMYSLIVTPAPELRELALELYEAQGHSYLAAALTVRFLTSRSEECFQYVHDALWKKGVVRERLERRNIHPVTYCLSHIFWEESTKKYVFRWLQYDPVLEKYEEYCQPLKEELSPRLAGLIIKMGKIDMDQVLAQWINPQEPVLCELLGEYFYKRALSVSWSNMMSYLPWMSRCGWSSCSGLAVSYAKKAKNLHINALLYFMESMPGSKEEWQREGERVMEEGKAGKIRINGDWEERLHQWIVDQQMAL